MCAILGAVATTSTDAGEISLKPEGIGSGDYEDFVMSSLPLALGVEAQTWVRCPDGIALDAEGSLPLVPGALWCNAAGNPILVIDARDKATTLGEVGDVLRVLSYCIALDLKRGVLVRDGAIRASHVFPAVEIEVFVEPLASTGTAPEVAARVRDLAERLRHLTENAR